jgi:hypothetical protein
VRRQARERHRSALPTSWRARQQPWLAIGFRFLPRHGGIGFIAGLVDRENLEALDRIGHRADLVLALQAWKHHLEVAAGELEHRALDRTQRTGDVPRDEKHHAAGKYERGNKKT